MTENLLEAGRRNEKKEEIRKGKEIRKGIGIGIVREAETGREAGKGTEMGREVGTRTEIGREAKTGKEIGMGRRKGTGTGITIVENAIGTVAKEGKRAEIEMMMIITEVETMTGNSSYFKYIQSIVFNEFMFIFFT